MEIIEKKVIEILKKYTPNDSVWEHFMLQNNLTRDLKINSARIVDIILDIEEEYKIEISNTEIEKVTNVQEVVQLISTKTAQ